MYAVDLHTHSYASPDGCLKAEDYKRILAAGRLHAIAVTDHDRIDAALLLRKQLGDAIIVGEEISTTQGEIIGLYLTKPIPAGLTAAATVAAIRAQKGLVYIPHPFERLRHGVSATTLQTIAEQVDIIEIHNGRASLDAKPKQAVEWALQNKIAMAASSDAHGPIGWGKTASLIDAMPSRDSLASLLMHADFKKGKVGLRGRTYPKLNRLRKRGVR